MITHGYARGNLPDENIELAILREQVWYNPETGIFSSRNHSGVRVKGFMWNGYIGVSVKSKKVHGPQAGVVLHARKMARE
ncbi:hypothetical protein WKC52_19410 [Morganella morganii]|uniref:hypothetical protein n=1 Tax=Morganella morganii TaxID=582 RepID=UPI003119AE97